ncbi:MAG: hypothetical protein A3G81_11080 [Betaproteobacteria bacterium RIFCSPLOWO2_12_FULL_65_14]|nr:MAG: hypothetical protein A3G81_11080 [Betaproteobacteria bacterium RIFCSPLOWO2_12_FULL_65_14]
MAIKATVHADQLSADCSCHARTVARSRRGVSLLYQLRSRTDVLAKQIRGILIPAISQKHSFCMKGLGYSRNVSDDTLARAAVHYQFRRSGRAHDSAA